MELRCSITDSNIPAKALRLDSERLLGCTPHIGAEVSDLGLLLAGGKAACPMPSYFAASGCLHGFVTSFAPVLRTRLFSAFHSYKCFVGVVDKPSCPSTATRDTRVLSLAVLPRLQTRVCYVPHLCALLRRFASRRGTRVHRHFACGLGRASLAEKEALREALYVCASLCHPNPSPSLPRVRNKV